MINYEEELAKFQPSLEIDEAEEAILHNDLTDISDIIELIVKSGKQKERGKILCPHLLCPKKQGHAVVAAKKNAMPCRQKQRCGKCGGPLKPIGTGTQRVQQELAELFPDMETIRMDADTVSAVNTHEKILARFREEKIPVLIGTQMVAKGLDIPDVTHIIQMDMPSNIDFFIHRVGRTGRNGKTGTNIVIGDGYEMRKLAEAEKKLKIIVNPRILYKGKLVVPDQVDQET